MSQNLPPSGALPPHDPSQGHAQPPQVQQPGPPPYGQYQGPPPGYQGGFPPPAPEQPKAKKPFYKKKRVIIPAALVAVIVAASATSGGDKKDEDATATEQPAAAAAQPSASAKASTKSSAKATPSKAAEPAAPAEPVLSFPGQKKDDKIVKAGAEVKISGWTTVAGPLKRVTTDLQQKVVCTTVKMTNRDDDQQDYSTLSWKMQSPKGVVLDATYTGEDDDMEIGGASLAPGATADYRICFDEKKAGAGQYIVFWQPDVFSSEDRGAWINKVAATS